MCLESITAMISILAALKNDVVGVILYALNELILKVQIFILFVVVAVFSLMICRTMLSPSCLSYSGDTALEVSGLLKLLLSLLFFDTGVL